MALLVGDGARARRALHALLLLMGCAPAHPSTPILHVNAPVGVALAGQPAPLPQPRPRVVLELAAFEPWSEDRLLEVPIYDQLFRDWVRWRIKPELARSSNGDLWLRQAHRYVRLGGQVIELPEFSLRCRDFAPLSDGGLLLADREWLARLDSTGRVLWKKSSARPFEAMQADTDDSIYLVVGSKPDEIWSLNLEDGSQRKLEGIEHWGWVVGRVTYSFTDESPTHQWSIRRCPLATGRCAWTVLSHALQLEQKQWVPLAYFSDGSALLQDWGRGQHTLWIGSDGEEIARMKLRVARDIMGPGASALFYSLEPGDDAPIWRSVAGTFSEVTEAGARKAARALFEQTQIRLGEAVLEPDDAVLLVAVDPQGTLIVRARAHPR